MLTQRELEQSPLFQGIDYEEYRRMRARIELLEILAESEEDVKFGRVAPVQDTFDDLRLLLTEESP